MTFPGHLRRVNEKAFQKSHPKDALEFEEFGPFALCAIRSYNQIDPF